MPLPKVWSLVILVAILLTAGVLWWGQRPPAASTSNGFELIASIPISEEKVPASSTVTVAAPLTSVKNPNGKVKGAAQIKICGYQTNSELPPATVRFEVIGWMGAKDNANAEWIELKNIALYAADISGWQIISRAGHIKIVIPEKTILLPGTTWLTNRTNGSGFIYTGALANSDEGLRLFDGACELRDEVEANPNWPAGDNVSKAPMERTENGSWQTRK